MTFMAGLFLGFALGLLANRHAVAPDPAYIVDMSVHFRSSSKQEAEFISGLLKHLGGWEKMTNPREEEKKFFSRIRMSSMGSPFFTPVTLFKRGARMLHPDSWDQPYCPQSAYAYECVNCDAQPRPASPQPPAHSAAVHHRMISSTTARVESATSDSAAGTNDLDILSNGGSQWTTRIATTTASTSPVPWAARQQRKTMGR